MPPNKPDNFRILIPTKNGCFYVLNDKNQVTKNDQTKKIIIPDSILWNWDRHIHLLFEIFNLEFIEGLWYANLVELCKER